MRTVKRRQKPRVPHEAEPSKLRSRKTPYNGRVYDSAKEAAHAQVLDAELAAGHVVAWEYKPKFKLTIAGEPFIPYTGKRQSVLESDFLVTFRDGHRELHEVKGYVNRGHPITRLWMCRYGILRHMEPDLIIRII